MALEDGVILAKCLRDAPTVADAFTAFDTLRRARVEAVVAMGAKNGSNKITGPLGRFIRDLVIARSFRKQAASGVDPQRWVWDHHIDWASPVLAGDS